MIEIPDQFKEKFTGLLGQEEAGKLLESLQEPSKKAYRINSLKKGAVAYPQEEAVPGIPNAYYGEVYGKDPEWTAGLVYSQDPAAMFPAHAIPVKPGDKVLDLCAAPGGKSTALAQKLEGQGLLVANEISPSRAKILRENLERWGVANAIVTNCDSFALSARFPGFFDAILVDAPCSGEGMFRKSEDAIKYWSQENVDLCADRQREILTEAVKMLKPGGYLLYSTCTFSPEEDEEIVSWLLDEYGFKLLPIAAEKAAPGRPEWGNGDASLANCARFWPQDGVGEGQFVASLQKAAGEDSFAAEAGEVFSPVRKSKDKKKKGKGKNKGNRSSLERPSKEESGYISEAIAGFNWPESLASWPSQMLKSQDHVFVPALEPELLKGIKVLNNGLELGILKKKRFEPSHQLAEVLGQVDQERVVDLTEDEYDHYLHGESLQVNSSLKGFVLVSCRGMIFSFGKLSGRGQLKNYYPKGLRQ